MHAPELTPAADLRFRLNAREIPNGSRTDEQLQKLLDHVNGDFDTAVDALAMKPWPAWLLPLMR